MRARLVDRKQAEGQVRSITHRLRDEPLAARGDPNPVVSETARRALDELDLEAELERFLAGLAPTD